MMHWYCARLTPLRNTALGSGSFCNAAFFSTNGESNKLTVTCRHHKRELRGQDNLQIYYSSASAMVLSKGTEPR